MISARDASCTCDRFGHSQVGSELWRLEADGSVSPRGHLNLRDAYFSPERVLREGGIDPLLRGSVRQPAQEVDTLVREKAVNMLLASIKSCFRS